MLGGERRRRALGRAVIGLLLLPACSASTETQAVVATGVMVAATGVNRALTGACWAACTPGYVCDHESGLCVPGECSPECPETQVCVRLDGGLVCADKSTTWIANGQGGVRLPSGAAPAKARVGASGAASGPSAARGCALPGSAAWYEEQAEEPTTEPAGQLARDMVGLWSVVGTGALDAPDAPRPLIVTAAWFGRSKGTATRYRTLAEAGARLELEVWSDAAPAAAPLSVEFGSRDRFRLHGVDYQREDCAHTAAHSACCALPRASWVRLGPLPEAEPSSQRAD